jgi:hypothetical protein
MEAELAVARAALAGDAGAPVNSALPASFEVGALMVAQLGQACCSAQSC